MTSFHSELPQLSMSSLIEYWREYYARLGVHIGRGWTICKQPTDLWHIFLICIHRHSRPKPISLQPLPKFLHEPAVPADVAAYLLPWWVGGWWGGCCWAQAVESARQLSHHHHTTPSWNFTEHPNMWYIYFKAASTLPLNPLSACQRRVWMISGVVRAAFSGNIPSLCQ